MLRTGRGFTENLANTQQEARYVPDDFIANAEVLSMV